MTRTEIDRLIPQTQAGARGKATRNAYRTVQYYSSTKFSTDSDFTEHIPIQAPVQDPRSTLVLFPPDLWVSKCEINISQVPFN